MICLYIMLCYYVAFDHVVVHYYILLHTVRSDYNIDGGGRLGFIGIGVNEVLLRWMVEC